MRARLFCRHSDPAALIDGLRSVESCAARVGAVSRSLEQLLEGFGVDPVAIQRDRSRAASPQLSTVDLLADAVEGLGTAHAEMVACAEAIEVVAESALGAQRHGEVRWAHGELDHHPELLMVGLPVSATDEPDPADCEVASTAGRHRLQVSAVKDRYTVVLPGLPWVGEERNDFAGARLTLVRSQLESVEENLRLLALGTQVLDLTDM